MARDQRNNVSHCPHCEAPLPPPIPAARRLLVCPACAGSLRPKHLKAGCLTSAPKLLVLGLGAALLVRAAWDALASTL